MSKKLRIVFMGTPDFVLPLLEKIAAHPAADLVCVYTQPPRPKGRGKETQSSPVHMGAEQRNISVRTPENFRDEKDVADFKALNADLAVVAAYGMLLPDSILNAPAHGCVNIHPSLLPRWRGTSPIQFALWEGDAETGVCLMKLVRKMDAGPIVECRRRPVLPDATYESLSAQLWDDGAALVGAALDRLAQSGAIPATAQAEEGVTFTRKLTKEDGRIDWKRSAARIDCQIRGLNPWPGTWCETADGKRLKILRASVAAERHGKAAGTILDQAKIACGEGTVLQLITLQPEGKKPMDGAAALNGGYVKPGHVLS